MMILPMRSLRRIKKYWDPILANLRWDIAIYVVQKS